MATPLPRRPEADGASPQVVPAGSGPAGYAVPAILDHKHPIAHAMYWSNSFSGGVLIALAAAGLGCAALRRTAR